MTIWLKIMIALVAIMFVLAIWLRYIPFAILGGIFVLTTVTIYLRQRWDEKHGNISS